MDYVVIFLIIKNLQIWGHLGMFYDTLFIVGVVLLVGDLAVMGYLYRQYYGRSLLHEQEVGDPPILRVEQEIEAEKNAYEIKRQQEAEDRVRREEEQLTQQKKELRVVRTIQGWWRRHLYQPPDGVWYLRTKQHFQQMTPTQGSGTPPINTQLFI